MADPGDVVERLASLLHQPAQAVEVVGQRARLELRAFRDLALGPGARGGEHLVDALGLDDDRAVESSTTASPWRIVAPPTSTGSPIVPGTTFSAPRTRT